MTSTLPTTWPHEPMEFEDVFLTFTKEEWAQLDHQQKCLYREIMLENYNNMISVEHHFSKPNVISELEEVEDFWPMDREIPQDTFPGQKRAPDTIVDRCEPPFGCWELNSEPLEEQPMLLTSEPPLQFLFDSFYVTFVHIRSLVFTKCDSHCNVLDTLKDNDI